MAAEQAFDQLYEETEQNMRQYLQNIKNDLSPEEYNKQVQKCERDLQVIQIDLSDDEITLEEATNKVTKMNDSFIKSNATF